MQAVAGNASLPFGFETAGYGGDGLLGGSATLNSPNVLAVDSAGNVYFADDGNALIREVNGQSGIITTVAGKPPNACIWTICSNVNSGCSEAVATAGNPVGGNIQGIAVDAYGNLYFSDNTTQSISVIYRGGSQVAAFIKLVDPSGVAISNGVQQGLFITSRAVSI
jgi:streptogramin lyase